MIKNDRVYAAPLVQYRDTKTNIEALSGIGEGAIAYATDTDQFGSYNGTVWTWGQGGGGAPVTTAVDDFQVGDGAGNWIKKTLAETVTILRTILDTIFAPIAKGVTNGDSHDHNGGDGAQIAHTNLSSIGTNTHAQIDTHIAAVAGSNAHGMREVLTAARTYYVRTDGSDSNTGLVNSAGGAFLTVQKAINVIATLDNGGYDITIQIADGTYTGTIVTAACLGNGQVIIQGNSGTPTNVVISVTSNNAITHNATPTVYQIKNLKVTTTTSGNCIITNSAGAYLIISGVDFGSSAGAHIAALSRSKIGFSGNYTVSGGATYHWYSDQQSQLTPNGRTVTFSNSPTFSVNFAFAGEISDIYCLGMTFTNKATVTATRYNVIANSVIQTNGGGATYLPGGTAGSTASGGQYL